MLYAILLYHHFIIYWQVPIKITGQLSIWPKSYAYRTSENFLELSRTFQIILDFSRTFWNILELTRTSEIFQECSRTLENNLELSCCRFPGRPLFLTDWRTGQTKYQPSNSWTFEYQHSNFCTSVLLTYGHSKLGRLIA